MRDFGKSLGRLRAALRRDLKLPGLPREKVLALVVKLLDSTQVRVGNAEYARDNGSFGLTTLRDRHVRYPGRGRVLLRFRGKGGAEHDVLIEDPRLAKLVRRCQQLPGQALFQYLDDEGKRHSVGSGQVNDYLRERMGGEFTAKDFRTWHATLHALTLLGRLPLPERRTERALRQCINTVVKEVASGCAIHRRLCRKSYINPAVFTAWQDGKLGGHAKAAAALLSLLSRKR
jgi:DNA topoisomerase IB